MREKGIRLLALLLVLLLLSGCAAEPPARLRQALAQESAAPAAEAPQETEAEAGEIPRFEDIPYERPDLEALQVCAEAVAAALGRGAGLAELEELIELFRESYDHYSTMYAVAMIRSFQDSGDRYYAEEYAWCDSHSGQVQRCMEQMYYDCGESALAEELEEQVFWPGFAQAYSDRSQAVYSEELVALLDQESTLLSQYHQLQAESEEALQRSLSSPDGQNAPYQALVEHYQRINGRMAEIYIGMVKVRQEMARLRGYDSYEAMVYDTDYDRDYNGAQVAAYDREVKTWLAPLYRQLVGMNRGYEEMGELSTRRLYRCLKSGAERMGGKIADAFSFMTEHGLYDIREDPAKADISFQTYLADYEAPYLFICPNGSLQDLCSFAHEFGHYVDAYVNGDDGKSVDVAEIYSLTMEYLMLSRVGGELAPEEREQLTRLKLLDTLELYVQQCSFNAFEQAVYAADPDTLSAEWLNEQSLLLAMDYGYYDGVSEEYYAMSWSDINHFFEAPFYVVAYPLASDLALQLYQRELEEEGAGLAGFLSLLDNCGDGLEETAALVGLEDPLAEGRVKRLSELLSALLLP